MEDGMTCKETSEFDQKVAYAPVPVSVLIINADIKNLPMKDGVYQIPPESVTMAKVGDPVFIAGGKYRSGSIEYWINTGKFRLSDVGKLGDTVFLTREEAEKRIAEWKEKKYDPTYDRGW